MGPKKPQISKKGFFFPMQREKNFNGSLKGGCQKGKIPLGQMGGKKKKKIFG